jgi:hypothetical protein
VLNFAIFEQLVDELGTISSFTVGLPNEVNHTLEKTISAVKEQKLQDLLANIPFIADLVEVFKNSCEGSQASHNKLGKFSLTILQKDASFTLYQETESLGQFWDVMVS